ncbi:MAG: peptidoglycan D,D-transpeptidase FtsI family protein [Anaplasma sp.]
MDRVEEILECFKLRNAHLHRSRRRLMWAAMPFLIFFVIIVYRLVMLTVVAPVEAKVTTGKKSPEASHRFMILDRNDEILATDVPIVSLFADATRIDHPESAAERLSATLGHNEEHVRKLLTSRKKFVWIKRDVAPEEEIAIRALGLKGLGFTGETKRVYPHGELFAHVLGYVDLDGKGITGIERCAADSFGTMSNVRLSVDVRVQNVVREEVLYQMDKHEASAGAVVVMDVRNGEILALVSIPDFDLNSRSKADSHQRFNRAALGVYEMGSVFKLFTLAGALDSGKISIEDSYDVSKPFTIGQYQITDMCKAPRSMLSVREIFVRSSNIGMAKIATDLGKDVQLEYFEKMALLSSLNLEIPETGSPIFPRGWPGSTAVTASYGYGIAVTPVHVVQAAAGIVNYGIMHKATLLLGKKTESRRVVSSRTSEEIRRLLRFTVENGTGKGAEVKGYSVGGKTGSAKKVVDGKYKKDANLASFLGIFPTTDPKYAIMVIIDEPKGSGVTNGIVAAPVVGRIIGRIAPMLSVAPIAW